MANLRKVNDFKFYNIQIMITDGKTMHGVKHNCHQAKISIKGPTTESPAIGNMESNGNRDEDTLSA